MDRKFIIILRNLNMIFFLLLDQEFSPFYLKEVSL